MGLPDEASLQLLHSSQPTTSSDIVMKPGEWQCPKCHAINFPRRVKCFKCNESKPGGDQEVDHAASILSKEKRMMCKHFMADGTCKKGENCTYAHGVDELR